MRILIAGIGNIFFGDDAFGCEVIRELSRHELPESVTVMDFGIRGLDLAYALADNFDAVILVDACPRGGKPGSVYLIEADTALLNETDKTPVDGHALNPVAVIQMAKSIGRTFEKQKLFLVGCEPDTCENEDGRMDLSPTVKEAIPHALEMIHSLVRDLRTHEEKQGIAGLAPAERKL